MSNKVNWTLDSLKSQLNALLEKKELKAWIINQEHVHRRERYFMMEGKTLIPDQDRSVHSQSISLKIFVPVRKAGRQGEMSKKLFPSLPLAEQLTAAIQAARETDHQEWELPSRIMEALPQLQTTDPRMGEDLERVMMELSTRVERAVAKKRETRFDSAELFLSIHDTELHLSNGLIHRSSQSRVYAEAAFSYTRQDGSGATESDEYLNTRWAVSLDDLPLEEIFDETSERAHSILDVEKPRTGKYPVIIDAEVLATLFNNHLAQLSSANAYHGLPFVKPGDDLIPGATGDPVSIWLDPSVPFGADTTAVSEQGMAQTPFRLVDQNRVMATSTDKRYSDYLATPVTTVRGNVVVAPGTLTYQELTRQGPQVIEILQFSGLFADPNSGTFSSEIRLARLHDNETGKVTYLKGGSLSGSFTENFRGVRFSDRKVKRATFSSGSHGEGYYGPEYALLSDVSIVG